MFRENLKKLKNCWAKSIKLKGDYVKKSIEFWYEKKQQKNIHFKVIDSPCTVNQQKLKETMVNLHCWKALGNRTSF